MLRASTLMRTRFCPARTGVTRPLRQLGLYCKLTLRQSRLLWCLLAAALVATRFCHTGILWEGDAYPLAGAQQLLHGKALYRDIWFDKPPLLPLAYLLFGALPGWPLRLFGACYSLLACWIAYAFGRELWSEREGRWAAALLGFSLCFDFPAAAIPVASDLLMLAPHLAAMWLASRRPFWSGVLAAVAFWINPKGALVAAVCVLWNPAGTLAMAAGFGAVSAAMLASLAGTGALAPYWEQVWRWGRLYAARPFEDTPLRNGILRTLGWAGFHAALVTAAAWCWVKRGITNPNAGNRSLTGRPLGPAPMHIRSRNRQEAVVAVDTERRLTARWMAWLLISLAGVAAGLRFFPRYYFLLLPVVVMMAARGFTLLKGRSRFVVCLLLLIPVVRFGSGVCSRGAQRRLARHRHGSRQPSRRRVGPRDGQARRYALRLGIPSGRLRLHAPARSNDVSRCTASHRRPRRPALDAIHANRNRWAAHAARRIGALRSQLHPRWSGTLQPAPGHWQLSRSARLAGELSPSRPDGRDRNLSERDASRFNGAIGPQSRLGSFRGD